MKITRTSILTGVTRTKELDLSVVQLQQIYKVKNVRWLVPQLSPWDIEFIITGNTQDDYEITSDNQ